MPRFLRLAALAIAALAATGCAAALTVSAHKDPTVDFTKYRTYEWAVRDALPANDPRLSDNPDFKDRLEGAVERQMAARGFEKAGSAPDLLVHYHASTSNRIDVNRIDSDYGYCYEDDCRVRVMEYEAGTVVIDMVDARTNRLVWRGWARGALDDMLDPDSMARRLNDAVARMLTLLPPAL